MKPVPQHKVKVKFVKTRDSYEGACSHPRCKFEVWGPNTPEARQGVKNQAEFHEKHPPIHLRRK